MFGAFQTLILKGPVHCILSGHIDNRLSGGRSDAVLPIASSSPLQFFSATQVPSKFSLLPVYTQIPHHFLHFISSHPTLAELKVRMVTRLAWCEVAWNIPPTNTAEQINPSSMDPPFEELLLAVEIGDEKTCDSSFDTKNVNQLSKIEGYGPFHAAAARGEVRMCELLLNKKGDPNLRNVLGQTPLHVAAMNGQLEVVKWLLQDPSVKKESLCLKDNDNETPIACASTSEIALVLLKSGASLLDVDVNGDTPLHITMYGSNPESMLRLFQQADQRGEFETAMLVKNNASQTPSDIKAMLLS